MFISIVADIADGSVNASGNKTKSYSYCDGKPIGFMKKTKTYRTQKIFFLKGFWNEKIQKSRRYL